MNVQGLLKQVQKVQAETQRVQSELAGKTVEGSAGGGMVTVVMTGSQEVREVRIDEDAFSSGDREMLEAMIAAAVNDAVRRVQELTSDAMSKIMGGLPIPPGLL